MDLSRTPVHQPTTQSVIPGCTNVSLIARVYLKLGTWQWALSPGLDDDSIQGKDTVCLLFNLICLLPFFEGKLLTNSINHWLFLLPEILGAFHHATHCATKWAKSWHKWALFNTAVMSHYTLRSFPSIASEFVVAAVTGYFHSIACAAHAKGVDDSLQVLPFRGYFLSLPAYGP